MKKNYRYKMLALIPVLAAIWFFSPLLETADAAPGRRLFRKHNVSKNRNAVPVDPQGIRISDDEFNVLCERIKADAQAPTEKELELCKNRLLRSCVVLTRAFQGDAELRDSGWKDALGFDALKESLSRNEGPADEVLQKAWNALQSDRTGARWAVFGDFRRELRRYRTLQAAVRDGNYVQQLSNVCDNLAKYVDEYSKNGDPGYGAALFDVMLWLEDADVVEPRMKRLAAAVSGRISETNVRLHASKDFIAAGFRTETSETFDILENIQGTRIVGTGEMSATSDADLIPSRNGAIIRLFAEATMNSQTTGYHRPVTLDTETTGVLRGEKRIRISPEGISTYPARSKADLNARIYNLRVNAGPLVRCVAQNQVRERQPDAQAEARRRAERRMNEQIDRRVNERIAELNANYQEKIRQPLLKTDLFPKTWNVSSSETVIDSDLLVGERSQPGAATSAPNADREFGVFVQIHQSALNNAAAVALSGRAYDEEKVREELEKQFKELPDALKRDEDQKPLNVTFAQKGPVAISFVENRIKAVFRIDSFIQDGSRYPGLDITLLYDVKMEKKTGEDGKEQVLVVLEQAEAPQAYPRGFIPGGEQRISARHQAIRTIVLKRLESALPKRFEGKPRELKGEWEGAGQLVPVFASSNDGWLTFAWDWIPAK